MNSYILTRKWFDYAGENANKVKAQHTSLYMFAIEHCNRLGWIKQFGFPSSYSMEYSGISTYKTYIKTLNELIEYGFIEMISKSKNQYSANIIALVGLEKEESRNTLSALDRAIMNSNSITDFALVKNTEALTEATTEAVTKAVTRALTKAVPKLHLEQNPEQDISRSSVNKPTKPTKPTDQLNNKGVIKEILVEFLKSAPQEKKEFLFNEILEQEEFRIFLEKKRIKLSIIETSKKEKEKSSAKKEKDLSEISKHHFLQIHSGYIWEATDDYHLGQLLKKIQISLARDKLDLKPDQAFKDFLENLPNFWRKRKFSLQNLNQNYNEILNEIRQKSNGQREKSTQEERKFGRHTTEKLADFAKNFGK